LIVYATQPILPVLTKALGITAFLSSLTVTASTLGMALTAPMAENFRPYRAQENDRDRWF
jgi:hypothetical protein